MKVFRVEWHKRSPSRPHWTADVSVAYTKKPVTSTLMLRALIWRCPANLLGFWLVLSLPPVASLWTRLNAMGAFEASATVLVTCLVEPARATHTISHVFFYSFSMSRPEVGMLGSTTPRHFCSCNWPKFPQTLLCSQHILFLPVVSASIWTKSVTLKVETVYFS
jgi:hypothetical protein